MSTSTGVRTTIYLAGAAADALERVKTTYLERYGIGTTVSAVFARLLLGESIDDVIDRPFRADLARIAAERDKLREVLQRAHVRRRTTELHRIQRELADLFVRVKQISHTLGRTKRRNETYSADLAEAARLEDSLNELMNKCADVIVSRRRR
jgi:DNA repair exonuclease SbcCD ATPase subunit